MARVKRKIEEERCIKLLHLWRRRKIEAVERELYLDRVYLGHASARKILEGVRRVRKVAFFASWVTQVLQHKRNFFQLNVAANLIEGIYVYLTLSC